jgi:hypothetical protein
MGRQFITPLQDASIYERFPNRNTGFDEILEVGKLGFGGSVASSSVRCLIQFDVTKFVGIPATTSASFFLNLRIANAISFQRNQEIEIYEATGSWDEGTGFFEQDLENPQDGVTWEVMDAAGNFWTESIGQSGGATESLVTAHTFDWEPADIRIDVSGQVRAWLTGSTNSGLLIRIPIADELNNRVETNIRFFSRNTHTIYPPTLEAVWPTQTMSVTPNSGLGEAPDESTIFIPNLQQLMATGSTHRIRFGVREVQPIKSFSDTFRFSNKFFLPSASYIGVQDAATKAFIVPFDTGSLLSADGTGSFFDLKIENMYINRTYKILVRTQKPWGPEVIDTGHTFKVV